jgi:hypothetical protein
MDDDHEQCLHEQGRAEVRAEPIVYFEYTGDEHNERDIEGETGGGARAVHRVDLVAIAGYWRCCDAGNSKLVCNYQDGDHIDVQYRRDILHNLIEYAHLVYALPWKRGSGTSGS